MWMENEAPRDTALYAVSVYVTARSPVPVRYYYHSEAAARLAASEIRRISAADRVLLVWRPHVEAPWRPLVDHEGRER